MEFKQIPWQMSDVSSPVLQEYRTFWSEWSIKQSRCCRSALGCLTCWASFYAGAAKWVCDSSVLEAALAAPRDYCARRVYLRMGAWRVSTPQRAGLGLHEDHTRTRPGNSVSAPKIHPQTECALTKSAAVRSTICWKFQPNVFSCIYAGTLFMSDFDLKFPKQSHNKNWIFEVCLTLCRHPQGSSKGSYLKIFQESLWTLKSFL